MSTSRQHLKRSNREWFTDRRAPGRRLQVTGHGDQGTTVLSIWHGDTCAGTFQLPVEESARLIGHLADCLSPAATAERSPVSTPASWMVRLRSRMRRARADIIPIRRR
jgi:hypothetical protein